MKRIITVLLCAVMMLCAVSCSGSDVPDGMRLASSENEAFYLYVPEGWTVNTSGGTASAYYTSADRSNVSMTCMLQDDGLTTLEEYETFCREQFTSSLPGYAADGESSSVKLGGQDAVSFEYTATVGKINYKYRQVVTLYKDIFYILTFTSTAENYKSHVEDVAEIVASVVFK